MEESLKTTLQLFFSMSIKVYVIQQAPVHSSPSFGTIDIFRNLFNKGQLTNANIRKASCSRQEYIEQQAGVESIFAKFNTTRGLTFIYIDDVICDAEFCSVGVGDQPFFADNFHMTTVGVLRLKNRIQKYLAY